MFRIKAPFLHSGVLQDPPPPIVRPASLSYYSKKVAEIILVLVTNISGTKTLLADSLGTFLRGHC